jgi:hypothetical protein
MKTIKELRQTGYKVRVNHERNHKTIHKINGTQTVVDARGGKTTIEVTTPNKAQTVVGQAVCSEEDNFNHKIGNQIALGRALQQFVDLSK